VSGPGAGFDVVHVVGGGGGDDDDDVVFVGVVVVLVVVVVVVVVVGPRWTCAVKGVMFAMQYAPLWDPVSSLRVHTCACSCTTHGAEVYSHTLTHSPCIQTHSHSPLDTRKHKARGAKPERHDTARHGKRRQAAHGEHDMTQHRENTRHARHLLALFPFPRRGEGF